MLASQRYCMRLCLRGTTRGPRGEVIPPQEGIEKPVGGQNGRLTSVRPRGAHTEMKHPPAEPFEARGPFPDLTRSQLGALPNPGLQ